MAVFGLLGGQDRGQALERVRRIHRAGRVVRGVDEHGLHVRVERGLERLEVDLEVLGVGRHDGQLGAGARGREDVVAGVCHAETFVEVLSDRLFEGRDAKRGGVAVDGHRVAVLIEVNHGVGEGFRGWHGGIAKTVIEHILVADFGTAARGILAQLTNHGLAAKHGLVFLIDHGILLVYTY